MPNGVPMSWLRTSYDHPPLWVDDAKGARFRDVDGNEYADFNIADMSMFAGYGPEPVVDAVSRRIAAGLAVPAAERGLDLGRDRARPPLRPAAVAVHAERDAREPRGDPGGPRRDRTREGALLHRQVPRPLRRGARRARGTASSWPRRPGCRATSPATSCSCRSTIVDALRAALATRRHRDRHDRARAHERDRAPAARARLPRRAARRHPRDRHAALLRRDPHAGGRGRRAHRDVGPRSRRRHDRQVDRRRRAARRLRHDRRGRRDAAAPRRSRRRDSR